MPVLCVSGVLHVPVLCAVGFQTILNDPEDRVMWWMTNVLFVHSNTAVNAGCAWVVIELFTLIVLLPCNERWIIFM